MATKLLPSSVGALLVSTLAWTAMGCRSDAVPPVVPAAEAPRPPIDADGDGIPDDGSDKCLLEKEDGLPPDPTDGCKSTDPDGDGILGDADRCPNEKEDGLPPDPKDGCISPDPDGDGIIGASDKCPDQPETKNGFEDDDGCPDVVPRVRVTKTEVKINEKIQFAFGKATIEKASDELVHEIADAINKNPQIEFFEVAGHADKVGTDSSNVALTRQRAHAVAEALAKLGVDRRRMRAQGYGRYCPLDSADTDDAREKNRRVEFKILRIDGVETGVSLGCAEATEKGLRPAGAPTTAPAHAAIEKQQKGHTPPKGPANAASDPGTAERSTNGGKAPKTPKVPKK